MRQRGITELLPSRLQRPTYDKCDMHGQTLTRIMWREDLPEAKRGVNRPDA